MTLSEIGALLATADPDIRHYFSMSGADAYSYWEETRRLNNTGDDCHGSADQAWRFLAHRFTRTEDDETAWALFNALDGDERTTVRWITDTERDTGYIHHIFECEGY